MDSDQWLHQNPVDLDLQCLQKRIKLGSAEQGLDMEFTFNP